MDLENIVKGLEEEIMRLEEWLNGIKEAFNTAPNTDNRVKFLDKECMLETYNKRITIFKEAVKLLKK